MIEKIDGYFQIVYAMNNCYHPISIQDTSHDNQIAEQMLKLVEQTNKIKGYCRKNENKGCEKITVPHILKSKSCKESFTVFFFGVIACSDFYE